MTSMEPIMIKIEAAKEHVHDNIQSVIKKYVRMEEIEAKSAES